MASVLVNISAGKEAVGQPWLWKIGREFNVTVNIVKASVDTDFGYLQIELGGEIEDIQRTIAWLMTTGLSVEALSRAVGA